MFQRTTSRRIFAYLGIVIFCVYTSSGCMQSNGNADDVASPPKKSENKKTPYTIGSTPNAPRLLRRLTLDILGQLPVSEDRQEVRDDPTSIMTIMQKYLETESAMTTLADNFRWIWGLRAFHLPDLELLIAQGDTNLDATLTTDMRHAIINEPVQLARYVFSQKLHFSSLFTANHSVAPTNVLTLWGMTPTSQPWPNEDIFLGEYNDSRPASGLISTHGFLAGFSSEQRTDLRARTWSLMKELTCLDHDLSDAHLFADLPETALQGDLATYANNHSPCATCHRHGFPLAPTFDGLGAATNFNDWLAYTPTTQTPSHYAGHEFTGLAQLAELIGNDPRVQRCSIRRLYEATLQRPFNDGRPNTVATTINAYDIRDLYSTLDALRREEFLLPAVWPTIFAARTYTNGLANDNTMTKSRPTSIEMRFLSRRQWSAIALQFMDDITGLALTDDLDPGSNDTLNPEYRTPAGPYWHAANRIARQLASGIVATELANNAQAAERKLLILLPDGAGNTASSETIKAQIITLWEQLTSFQLDAEHAQIEALYALWQAAAENSGTANAHRNAWRTVLTACFLSDQFVTY